MILINELQRFIDVFLVCTIASCKINQIVDFTRNDADRCPVAEKLLVFLHDLVPKRKGPLKPAR